MINNIWKHAVSISCALMLSACSSWMQVPDTEQHKWRIEGKLGITTPEESLSGFLIWEQNQDQYDIHVSGPLGQGSTQIKGDKNGIMLTQGKHSVSSDDPSQLIEEQMGWKFPIQNLRYWIIGEASPFSQAESQYDGEQLSELNQDNWKVEYHRYDAYTGLPSRLRISQGGWRFLLVIKRWNVAS